MDSLDTVREMIRDGGIDCDASEAGHLKIAHRPGRAAGAANEKPKSCSANSNIRRNS